VSRARLGADRSTEELEETRDFLLRSLSDLDQEHGSGDIDDADYAALRDDYTARAAEVLRALEARGEHRPDWAEPGAGDDGAVAAGGTDPAKGGRRRMRRVAAALLGLGFVALAVALVVGAATGIGNRSASGRALDAATEARDLTQARADANGGDELGAVRLYQQVLSADPRQPEALAYEGWDLRQAGEAGRDARLVSQGRADVEAALAASPRYPDAHAFLGYMLLQDDHDVAGAVTQFRAFLADHPPAEMVSLTAAVVAQAFAAEGQPVPPPSSPPPG
jgi:tetratricopeptide (TPR) repeat protein